MELNITIDTILLIPAVTAASMLVFVLSNYSASLGMLEYVRGDESRTCMAGVVEVNNCKYSATFRCCLLSVIHRYGLRLLY